MILKIFQALFALFPNFRNPKMGHPGSLDNPRIFYILWKQN